MNLTRKRYTSSDRKDKGWKPEPYVRKLYSSFSTLDVDMFILFGITMWFLIASYNFNVHCLPDLVYLTESIYKSLSGIFSLHCAHCHGILILRNNGGKKDVYSINGAGIALTAMLWVTIVVGCRSSFNDHNSTWFARISHRRPPHELSLSWSRLRL